MENLVQFSGCFAVGNVGQVSLINARFLLSSLASEVLGYFGMGSLMQLMQASVYDRFLIVLLLVRLLVSLQA